MHVESLEQKQTSSCEGWDYAVRLMHGCDNSLLVYVGNINTPGRLFPYNLPRFLPLATESTVQNPCRGSSTGVERNSARYTEGGV